MIHIRTREPDDNTYLVETLCGEAHQGKCVGIEEIDEVTCPDCRARLIVYMERWYHKDTVFIYHFTHGAEVCLPLNVTDVTGTTRKFLITLNDEEGIIKCKAIGKDGEK